MKRIILSLLGFITLVSCTQNSEEYVKEEQPKISSKITTKEIQQVDQGLANLFDSKKSNRRSNNFLKSYLYKILQYVDKIYRF